MQAEEENRKPQTNAIKDTVFGGEKTKAMLWNLSSEMIGVYLWFLRFSNILLKLVQ